MLTRRDRTALFLLAIGTAALLPGALNRFVFPKLAVVLAGAIIACWCAGRGSLPRIVTTLLGLAGLLLAIAAINGAAPLAQLLGRPPRYEGLVALSVYAAALLAGARLLGPDRAPDALQWVVDCLAAAAVVIAVEALLEQAGIGALPGDVTRPGSLLGNASDEGAWAVLALGPLGCVALQRRSAVAAVGALAAATTLVLSGSRGALLGAVVVLVVSAAGLPRRDRLACLAAVAVIAAATLLVPESRNRVFEQTPHAAQSVTGHWLLARETSALVLDHPLLGVGPSGFVDAIAAKHNAEWERKIGPTQPPDSPESWLLQAGSAGGLPLLMIALAVAAITLNAGIAAVRRERQLLGVYAGLAGYAVALLFHFTSPGTTPLAALFAGILVAQAPRASRAERRSGPRGTELRSAVRVVATFAGGALLIVLIAGAAAEIPLRSALIDASRGEIAAADRSFSIARDLRPWDASTAADATHAFAVLAAAHYPGAAARGLGWARRERAAWPDSVQALTDTATLEAAAGRYGPARRALARARALDPFNPELR